MLDIIVNFPLIYTNDCARRRIPGSLIIFPALYRPVAAIDPDEAKKPAKMIVFNHFWPCSEQFGRRLA
jgi:hypothetical protein